MVAMSGVKLSCSCLRVFVYTCFLFIPSIWGQTTYSSQYYCTIGSNNCSTELLLYCCNILVFVHLWMALDVGWNGLYS